MIGRYRISTAEREEKKGRVLYCWVGSDLAYARMFHPYLGRLEDATRGLTVYKKDPNLKSAVSQLSTKSDRIDRRSCLRVPSTEKGRAPFLLSGVGGSREKNPERQLSWGRERGGDPTQRYKRKGDLMGFLYKVTDLESEIGGCYQLGE